MRLSPAHAARMLAEAMGGDGLAETLAQQIDKHLAHSYRNTVAAISMRASMETDPVRAKAMSDVAEWINSNILSGGE